MLNWQTLTFHEGIRISAERVGACGFFWPCFDFKWDEERERVVWSAQGRWKRTGPAMTPRNTGGLNDRPGTASHCYLRRVIVVPWRHSSTVHRVMSNPVSQKHTHTRRERGIALWQVLTAVNIPIRWSCRWVLTFWTDLTLHPEDGGDTFFRNVGNDITSSLGVTT
jgi:hypothetical protein